MLNIIKYIATFIFCRSLLMKMLKDIRLNQVIRDIVETIPDNIFIYGVGKKEGICLYANQNLKNALSDPTGKPFDPIGMHLKDIFKYKSKEEIAAIIADHKNIIKGGQQVTEPEQKQHLPNGDFYVYSVSKNPAVWPSLFSKGSFVVVGIGRDITNLFLAKEESEKAREEVKSVNEELLTINEQLKMKNSELENMNQQLQDANNQLNQFMRHVLHDIKNPAGSMDGFIGLIERELEKGVITEKRILDIKTFIGYIKKSSETIQCFIEDLSQYAKIKEKNMSLKIEEIEIQELFECIKNQQYGYLAQNNKLAQQNGIPEKNIDIIFDDSLKQLPLLCKSDKKLLTRLFTNLIGNAIKFTDKGSIRISVEKTGSMFCFSVTDTGVGIPEKDLKKILQEFQLSSIDYTPLIKGSGLGLSIVIKILEKLGGKMLPVQSELGKGSKFSFELPLKG